MSIKAIIVIVLRLFAIYLIVESLKDFVLLAPYLAAPPFFSGGESYFVLLATLFSAIGICVCSAVLWLSASRLAHRISQDIDVQVSFVNLTKEDLYSAAFIFLGLVFTLSALYPSVIAGYNFFRFQQIGAGDDSEKDKHLWIFLGHLLPLFSGFFCIFCAKKWTQKLIRIDEKDPSTSSG